MNIKFLFYFPQEAFLFWGKAAQERLHQNCHLTSGIKISTEFGEKFISLSNLFSRNEKWPQQLVSVVPLFCSYTIHNLLSLSLSLSLILTLTNAHLIHILLPMYNSPSVTQFGEISPLGQKFPSLWQNFDSLFLIRQNAEPTLANSWHCCANFQCSKWPNIEKI